MGGNRLLDEAGKRVRGEEKSVALYREIYFRYTLPGDFVVDFYGGTLSSAVAALQTGRRYLGIEIDPECYEPARNRLLRHASNIEREGWCEANEDTLVPAWPGYISPPWFSLDQEAGQAEQAVMDAPQPRNNFCLHKSVVFLFF